jgi:hypothetical protein
MIFFCKNPEHEITKNLSIERQAIQSGQTDGRDKAHYRFSFCELGK